MKSSAQREETLQALKELIIINNDRVEGYKKATEQTEDADLKQLFTSLAADSEKFSRELRNHVEYKDEAPERDETTFSGKIYRAWMDIRKALSANDRKAVLSSCEYGEDVALKTYDHVLEKHTDADAEVLALVKQQRSVIKSGHDKVKQLRDAAKGEQAGDKA